MNFQTIPPVEDADFYLDHAIKKAHEQAAQLRRTLKARDKFKKSENIEIAKIQNIGVILQDHLLSILKNFPTLDDLPSFYLQLVHITLDYAQFKKSLGALHWAAQQIRTLQVKTIQDMKKSQDVFHLNQIRRSFYGRASSVMKQINPALQYLEQCRKQMKSFPAIKTSLKTICIAGFPNVGKTTLLYKLTGSKPEINSYAFTTKSINVGYLDKEYAREHNILKKNEKRKNKDTENADTLSSKGKKERMIQIIDTPGTLNRFEKMNAIEQQAYLAQRELADFIIYVFDLTEPYPLAQQEALYQLVLEMGKPVMIYLSKTDILSKEKTNKFKHQHSSLQEIKNALLKDMPSRS